MCIVQVSTESVHAEERGNQSPSSPLRISPSSPLHTSPTLRCPITGEVATLWVPDPVRAADPADFEYEYEEERYGGMVCVCVECLHNDDMNQRMWLDWSEEWHRDNPRNDGND